MALGDTLATATDEARQLCRDDDLSNAHAVLRDALAEIPEWADDTDVAEATRLYASILAALGEPHTAQPWAARAYGICLEAMGPEHPETLAAAATLASVLRTLGENERAAHLYAYLADALSTVEGRRSPAALAARADLATTLHAQGDCERARAILAQAYDEHRTTYGDHDPATIKMGARLGRMARDCGDFLTAHEYFAEARAACQRYLGPDDPLTASVNALVHAPADASHVCGHETARTATSGWAPPAHQSQPGPAADPPGDWAPSLPPPPPNNHNPYAGLAPPRRPEAVEWPPDDFPESADTSPAAPEVPAPRRPAEAPAFAATGPGLRPTSPSAYGSGTATWADVRRQAAHTARPAHAPRRMSPVVLWLTVAAFLLVAAGAGAVALARTRADRDTPPPVTPPTTPGPTNAGVTAPGPERVRLTDNGTSVILDWALPAGAEGPLFVSGASGGSPLRPFQTLLPGSTTYTIHGLNPQLEYCFTLTLVYSTEVTAPSGKVCTRRTTPSPTR